MKENDDDHLLTWYRAFGPVLKVRTLETQLRIGNRCLDQWIAGTRSMPDEKRAKLLAWAQFFGYDPNRQYDQFL